MPSSNQRYFNWLPRVPIPWRHILTSEREVTIMQDAIAERDNLLLAREAEIRRLQAENVERENIVIQREKTIEQLQSEINQISQAVETQEPLSTNILTGRDGLNQQIIHSLAALDGWCSAQKAFLVADWILNNNIELAVEVGIYGGKSLVPMAHAMRFAGRGVVYGIEPWSNAIALEIPTNEANDSWWKSVDLAAVKCRFLHYLTENDLSDIIKIIEISSDEALQVFSSPRFAQKIDLVHIDGSHAEEQALRDVSSWLPLIRPQGIIVLDDICWPSVEPALRFLEDNCKQIAAVKFGTYSEGNLGEGFAAFRVPA